MTIANAKRPFLIRYVVVTGTRHPSRKCCELVHERLAHHLAECGRGMRIIVGDCDTGADRYARQFSRINGVTCTVHFKDPGLHPKKAPLERNTCIADDAAAHLMAGDYTVAEAFPGPESRGTWDCVNKLKRVGIKPEITEVPR